LCLALGVASACGGGGAPAVTVEPPPTGAITVGRLRTEYLENPLGIDVRRPRLEWLLASDLRGQRQTAYQILVASSEQTLAVDRGDLWSSGKVSSSRSIQIEYAGTPLASRQRAYWKVRVWDTDDHPSPYSAPAWWEMGLLGPADWRAEWIASPGTPTTGAGGGGPAPYFRKAFTIGAAVRRARLYATALGLYEISLNGARIGADHLAPGWTDYNTRLQYQTYDVTDRLAPGDNVLGLVVGDGWYAGRVAWWPRGTLYGAGPVRARAQLEVELQDGSSVLVKSDGSWRSQTGPIVSDDLLDGETYDARLEMPGWDSPGFDDAGWSAARTVSAAPSPALVADVTPGVQVTQELPAVTMTAVAPGVFVFDLGQNIAGWARLVVQGAAGAVATLRFAEVLNPDGTLYTANLRTARATDVYTLRGDGIETYEPRFTSHGFRYVELSGDVAPPTLASVTGVVAHSLMPRAGTFTASSPLLNQLQTNIVWAQRDNAVSIPTDSPQRDERLGWFGDALTFTRTAMFNMDVASFYTKWLRDVADSQQKGGTFGEVAPAVVVDFYDASPGWSDAGVLIPWEMYLTYGDTRVLADHYPGMRAWIDLLDAKNADHLWIDTATRGHDWGDWLAVDDDTNHDVLATALYAHTTEILARIARVLAHDADASRYESLAAAIKAAFNDHYVAADGHIVSDTQTAYALALRFGLLPDELRGAAAGFLADNIARHGGHLSTGFVGVSHLLPALSAAGRLDLAYQLLSNESYPSWGYMIANGATTTWERWDGIKTDGTFQDPSYNSFNHYAFGSVGEWLYAAVAGIERDEAAPAYESFVIRPLPGGGLTSASGRLETIHGTIASSWQLAGGTFTLDVEVPVTTTARVYLPFTGDVTESEPGLPPPAPDGAYVLGSGSYHFTVE
jgi:alpha-L-rhamnosidase